MTSAEAPPSGANVSGLLSEGPKADSVFDFLYHDARRVGSFLAQFETYGVPSQIRATESAGRSETTRATGGAGVDVLTIAKAQAALDVSTSTDERDTAERSYDPLWTNARALLDYLTEHDLIHRDVWAARVGQFVLAKGALVVLDIAMLKAAWGKPAIKRLIMQGMQGSGAPAPRRGKPHNEQKSEAELLIELLSILPHSIQGHLLGEDFSAWCSLAEASLVGMSSDLVLRHGSLVPGEWHMLGILDAVPDPRSDSEADVWALGPVDAAVAGTAGTMVGTVAAQLAPLARQLLGRPRTSFGMTPLLIFREVSGQ